MSSSKTLLRLLVSDSILVAEKRLASMSMGLFSRVFGFLVFRSYVFGLPLLALPVVLRCTLLAYMPFLLP